MNKVWDDLPEDLRQNPFFQFSEKTNFVPAWDKIKPEHIMPAMDYAFDLHRRNAQKIVENKQPANYKNTIEALEESGELAGYFFGILFNLMPGRGPAEDAYDETVNAVQRKYGKVYTDIYTNKALHERVLAVAKTAPFKNLNREQRLIYEMYQNTFISAGINLSAKKQAKLREFDEKITDLSFRSMNNMKMAGREFKLVVDDPARLKGLPESMIAAAAKKAAEIGEPGKWAFGLGKEVYMPFMQMAEDRDLRKQYWYASESQAAHGKYDNRATILELIKADQDRAHLLGYRHAAAYNISYNMAIEPKRVANFLTQLRKSSMPAAKRELKELQAFARRTDKIKKFEPWDMPFYQEKMKKDVLGYDEEQLRPYLELENTLKGVFRHFEKLLGLRFEETKEYPVYNPEVRAFNVYRKGSDKPVGTVFMDLLARDDKPPGTAWCAGLLSQGRFQGADRRPVDVIVTKFAKGEPTLITHYDMLVLMHEIGHSTHNLLSKCKYPSLSGFNVDGDFIEFPSQFQENYTFEPEFLDDVAVHYQTGEKMPDELKDKVKQSLKFMAGTQILEYAKKGWLDLSWYRADPKKLTTVEAFEKAATASYELMPRHGQVLSPHFSHLFGGGYEANFYSYQWSQIMEADVFAAFAERGLYDRSTASAYKGILEKGGTEWPSKLFHAFRHRNPIQKHFLARAGLLSEEFSYAANPEGVIATPAAPVAAPVVAQDNGAAGTFTAAGKGEQPGATATEAATIAVPPAVNDDRREETIDDIFVAPIQRPGPGPRHRFML
jgi:peptidyl-dipeptidase Dcp